MGKAKANMWAESVISSFSEKTNKVYDDIASGKQQKTTGKMQKFDQELYSEILKSLLSQDASPESEALQLFDFVQLACGEHLEAARLPGGRLLMFTQRNNRIGF